MNCSIKNEPVYKQGRIQANLGHAYLIYYLNSHTISINR